MLILGIKYALLPFLSICSDQIIHNYFILTECDKCVETLLNSTFTLGDTWTELWAEATLVGQLQERDAELQRLEPQANRTIQELTSTINSYSDLRAEIQQINQQQYYTDVNNLLNRVRIIGKYLEKKIHKTAYRIGVTVCCAE